MERFDLSRVNITIGWTKVIAFGIASGIGQAKRNAVSRSAKKLNMEFDSRFNGMSRTDREEFLNEHFPEWPKRLD